MISRAQIGQILKVYKTQGIASPLSKAEGVASGSVVRDDINLSFSQADLSKVRELVKKLPDVRLDKVESIAREIEAGTYKVDSMQVADKMMGRLLADRLK
jgi:negative regulator of flagellin synthesis FlgM